jgi:transposase, IS30 family
MPKFFAADDVDELLERVAGGMSLERAAGCVGVSPQSAARWWRASAPVDLKFRPGRRGGLPGSAAAGVPGARGPDDPPHQRRPLTSEDRAVIASGVRQRLSYRQIGVLIGRDKSVVSREVARNSGPDRTYRGPVAHRAAHERRRRPKPFRLIENPGLCRRIEAWLDDGWSPGLIARVLAEESPQVIMGRVCHETIYQALYVQTRGQLRRDLHRQLSLKRAKRKPRSGESRRACTRYREAFTISQRPAEVEDRAVPGHWEGDLILGAGNASAVGTLVERTTRFTMLLHRGWRSTAWTLV